MTNSKLISQFKILATILIVISLIWIIIYIFFLPKQSKYNIDEKIISGIIETYKFNGSQIHLRLRGKEKVEVFYTVKTKEELDYYKKHLGYGVFLTIKGTFSLPKENSIPNTFSYKKYLFYQHIFYIFKVDEIIEIQKPKGLWKLKNNLAKKVQTMTSPYIAAFILGEKSNLETELLEQNGISHLFAISGMHITLFATFLNKILYRLGKKRRYIIDIFLWLYAFMVNFTPSILRAILLYQVHSWQQKKDISLPKFLPIICIFFFLLLIDPYYLFDIGFQFSFLISFNLLFFKKQPKGSLKQMWKLSVFTFFISLPLGAIHFYQVNFLAIIYNILFIPFVSFIMYPLSLLSLLHPIFYEIAEVFFQIFTFLNEWLSNIKWGIVIFPKCHFLWWILYYYLFYLYYCLRYSHASFFLVIVLLVIYNLNNFNSHAYVTFLDVGQGDCALFISPFQKEVYMIDTGGMIIYQKQDWEQIKYSNYQVENITMYLKSLGIKEINTLILTHGDVDHLGNALELIEKIPIKTVYLNHNKQTKVEQEIVKKVPLISYEKLNNSFFRIEDYSLNAMSADENEASLILKLQVYQTVFLMMGDAPKKQENLLPNNFHADVLKVGHHGSNTSTSENLLKKVKPTIAVISVGLNNRYHHPHEEVIKLLKKSHAQIYQTSKEGSVTFKLNNYTLQIS